MLQYAWILKDIAMINVNVFGLLTNMAYMAVFYYYSPHTVRIYISQSNCMMLLLSSDLLVFFFYFSCLKSLINNLYKKLKIDEIRYLMFEYKCEI